MRLWKFYKKLLRQNLVWIRFVMIWGSIWAGVGALAYFLYPELLPRFLQFLKEVYRDILDGENLGFNLASIIVVFKNNLLASILSLFLGFFLGIVPLLAIAVNFFILGFLFAIPLQAGNFPGILVVLTSIFPHALLEIPAFLLAAAFGLRLGWSWGHFRSSFKQALQLLPLLTGLLFAAAAVEIFVTGGLIKLISP